MTCFQLNVKQPIIKNNQNNVRKFSDTRSNKSEERQYNGQKKKDTMINNCPQTL